MMAVHSVGGYAVWLWVVLTTFQRYIMPFCLCENIMGWGVRVGALFRPVGTVDQEDCERNLNPPLQATV